MQQILTTLATKSFTLAHRATGLAVILAVTGGMAYADGGHGGGGHGGHGDVPELDPATFGSALSLLAGGVLLLTDKIRRK